jgi:predicted Ser/Thr protein kinase/tetratricopeptide (TPR) repeat protein
MNLEDVLEAHLAGNKVDVPDELRPEFECAVAGHAALAFALDETIGAAGDGDDVRPPPVLPADYQIMRELGRGGMGVVYLVQQKSLGRFVAVKVLRPGEATFGKIVRRFLEEARHLARLRHPNIISIHEVGHAGEEPYFTMDYVDGQPLSAILDGARLPPSRALAIWKQAAAGVQHAHSQGIIHRDLKPGNILIDSTGRAYVSDFGLARDMTHSSQLTRTGEVMGTPAYMAPEQALGETDRIGETTDVYALGVILYEMLTGVPPFGRDAPANVLVRLLKEEPIPPRKIDRRIPRDLETICLKAMSRTPERRYTTVTALLEDIRRFEAGQSVIARRPGIVYRSTRFVQRHAKATAAAAIAAAIVLCLAWLIWAPSADEIVVEGDSQHGWGRHREAIERYQQALGRAGQYERLPILERIVRCAQESDDERTGVDAAIAALQHDPYAWFGKYNGEVARTVLQRQVTVKANAYPGIPNNLSTSELAALRLRMFLFGPDGTPAERTAAELELANVSRILGKRPEESMEDLFPGWKMPEQPVAELLESAHDLAGHPLERANLAYAAAWKLERAGRRDDALAAYRLAFELYRQTNPIYFGISNGIDSMQPRSLRLEPSNPRMLRHVAGTIRRLDPNSENPLRGGLRFRITGLDLPPELGLKLSLSLSDAAGPDADPGTVGEIPLQLDQTGWVGIVDGTYRLGVRRGASSGYSTAHRGARGSQLFQMLDIDCSAIPAIVEIKGTTIDLPPIRAFLLEEIREIEPDDGAAFNLADATFRWNAIPGAHHYELGFLTTVTKGGGTYLTPLLVCRTGSALALHTAELPPADGDKLRSLPIGTTGVWEIRGYDEAGRVMARSYHQRQFTHQPR